jgi:hypothetical protein
LCLVTDTSLLGARVVRELDAIVARRGRPFLCVSDNGTELTSNAILMGINSLCSGNVGAGAYSKYVSI